MKPVKVKHFKILLVALVTLILVLTAGVTALFYFFPEEKLLQIITEQAEKNLKRKVSIEKLNYSFTGISLKNVRLHNGSTSKDPVLLSAKGVSLGFSLTALLEKKISINYIVFNRLNVKLVFDEQGKSNLQSLLDEISTPGKKSEGSIEASIDRIRLNNMTLTLEKPKGNLAPLEGTYNLSALLILKIGKEVKEKSIKVTSCTINLPEKRGKVSPDVNITVGKTRINIAGTVGLKNTSITWTYRWSGNPKAQPYSRVTGDVTDLDLSIFPKGSPEGLKEKTTVLIVGKVSATSTLTNSPKIVYADGFARVDHRKRSVYLSNIKAKIDTSTVSLDRLHFSMGGKLYEFNSPSLSARFSDIRPLLKVIPGGLFGKAEGNISYSRKKINASLTISGAGYGIKDKIVSGLNTKINIADNLFKKENISMMVLGNQVTASVASLDPELNRIFINIKAPRFAIPEPKKTQKGGGDTSKSTAPLSFNIPITLAGRIDIGTLSYGRFSMNNLAARYLASGKKIDITQWQATVLKGLISGKGTILSSAALPAANLTFTFKDIKIQELGLITESMKDRFFGIGAGNGNLSYSLGSGGILKGIKGFVEFKASRGKIVNTGIQNGLGIWLSELKYKLRDLEFNSIYGNFLLDKGKFNINSFVFNSDDIRLKFNGLINSDWEASGMNISLEFTGNFIQDLPTPAIKLGLDRFRKGRWYVIPFVANGSIRKAKNIKRVK